jgi:hypothetical protein
MARGGGSFTSRRAQTTTRVCACAAGRAASSRAPRTSRAARPRRSGGSRRAWRHASATRSRGARRWGRSWAARRPRASRAPTTCSTRRTRPRRLRAAAWATTTRARTTSAKAQARSPVLALCPSPAVMCSARPDAAYATADGSHATQRLRRRGAGRAPRARSSPRSAFRSGRVSLRSRRRRRPRAARRWSGAASRQRQRRCCRRGWARLRWSTARARGAPRSLPGLCWRFVPRRAPRCWCGRARTALGSAPTFAHPSATLMWRNVEVRQDRGAGAGGAVQSGDACGRRVIVSAQCAQRGNTVNARIRVYRRNRSLACSRRILWRHRDSLPSAIYSLPRRDVLAGVASIVCSALACGERSARDLPLDVRSIARMDSSVRHHVSLGVILKQQTTPG